MIPPSQPGTSGICIKSRMFWIISASGGILSRERATISLSRGGKSRRGKSGCGGVPPCLGKAWGSKAASFSRIERTERGKPFSRMHRGFLFRFAYGRLLGLRGIRCAGGAGCGKKIGNAILLPSPGGSFHAKEAEYAAKSPEAFFAVWTAKESYVKLLGQGIDDGFARFSVVQKAVLQKRWGMCNFAPIFLEPGYAMCICGENLGEIQKVWMR